MRVRGVILGVVLLAGCDDVGPAQTMSLTDARANLMHVAGRGSADAFCTEAGRREFRQAVRTFSAAVEAEHAPNALLGVAATPDEAWGLVSMGVLARIVRPSDLRGQSQALAAAMDIPGATARGFTESRAAMEHACPQLITFYRELAEFARLQQRVREEADDMNDRQRRRLNDRAYSQQQRMMVAAQNLERKMRESGWNGETSSSVFGR